MIRTTGGAAALLAALLVASGVSVGGAATVWTAGDPETVTAATDPSPAPAPDGYRGDGTRDGRTSDGGEGGDPDGDRSAAVAGTARLSPADVERFLATSRSGVEDRSGVRHPYGDPVDGDRYLVHVVLVADDPAHAASLETLGAAVHVRVGRDVEVLATLEVIETVADAPFVEAVRPVRWLVPPPAPDYGDAADPLVRPQSGALTSQGVAEIGAAHVHARGVTGDGVTVGIIDGEFDPTNPEYAANLVAYRSFTGPWQDPASPDRQHGTAVAEVVVDVAPDVRLYFARPSTETQWAAAAEWLIDQDVDVITSSVGWSFGPHDGSSIVDRAVDDAVDAGVPVTVAAGNSANSHWEGAFRDANGDSFHEFDGLGNDLLALNGGRGLAPGQSLRATLSWDDWPTTDQDYDLWLVEEQPTGFVVLQRSELVQDGSPNSIPGEVIQYTSPVQTGPIYLAVKLWDADGTSSLEIFTAGVDVVSAVPEGSITSPGTSASVVAVGAFYHATDELEFYSSWGPTNDGRQGVDVIAPTRVFSSTYTDSFGFGGTSAANPHVAGTVALMLQADPSLSPADVERTLGGTAVDYGDAGPDAASGAGRIDALAAVEAVRTDDPGAEPEPGPTPGPDTWQTLASDPDEPVVPVDVASVAARDDEATLYFRYGYHGDYAETSPVRTRTYLDVDGDAATGEPVTSLGIGLDYVIVSGPSSYGLFRYDAATEQYDATGTGPSHFRADFAGETHEVGTPLTAIDRPASTTVVVRHTYDGSNPLDDFVPDTGSMSYQVGTSPTPQPDPVPDGETVVSVIVEGAPDGLRQYNVTVSGAPVLSVEPALIDGSEFQIYAGGPGATFVTARASDLAGQVGPFQDDRTLFAVTVAGDVDPADLSLVVHSATSDAGDDVSGRVRVTAPVDALFAGPLPGAEGPPLDIDGDGLYEDVDGDGDLDFDDAVALAFVEPGPLTAAQVAALDVDGDGDLDFDDAVELAFQV